MHHLHTASISSWCLTSHHLKFIPRGKRSWQWWNVASSDGSLELSVYIVSENVSVSSGEWQPSNLCRLPWWTPPRLEKQMLRGTRTDSVWFCVFRKLLCWKLGSWTASAFASLRAAPALMDDMPVSCTIVQKEVSPHGRTWYNVNALLEPTNRYRMKKEERVEETKMACNDNIIYSSSSPKSSSSPPDDPPGAPCPW